jgi:dihydrofolate reductase
MDWNKVYFAVGVFLFQQAVVQFQYQTVYVVSDYFGRTGGDDWNYFNVRITHQQHIDALLNAVKSAENSRVFVQGGGRQLETFLKMLGKYQPNKHHATLSAMYNANAVFYSNACILRSGGLAGKYGVDNPYPVF